MVNSPPSLWIHTSPNSTSNYSWVCFVQRGDRMLQRHLWHITHSYAALGLCERIMFLGANMMGGKSKPGLCESDVPVRFNSHNCFLTSISSSSSSLCSFWHQQEYLSQSQHRFRLKEHKNVGRKRLLLIFNNFKVKFITTACAGMPISPWVAKAPASSALKCWNTARFMNQQRSHGLYSCIPHMDANRKVEKLPKWVLAGRTHLIHRRTVTCNEHTVVWQRENKHSLLSTTLGKHSKCSLKSLWHSKGFNRSGEWFSLCAP